jgi:hypothetical protein
MKTKVIGDLGIAAYLLLNNFKFVGRKSYNYYFELTDKNTEEMFDRHVLDYLSNEFHRFDSCIMSLKKMYNLNVITKNYCTDLGAAAYLLMHKYKMVGKNGKFIYFEEDDMEAFEKIVLDYLSSDFHKYDSCIMSLKKVNEHAGNLG